MDEEIVHTNTVSRFQGLQLLIVQSSVCIIFLLLMLSLKALGGDAYQQASTMFRSAMMNKAVVTLDDKVQNTEEPATPVVAVKDVKETISVPLNNKIVNDKHNDRVMTPPLTGGILTSAFGNRTDPFDSDKEDVHYGVDIAAEKGTKLLAMTDGVVSDVGYNENGYGHYIIVDFDDTHSYLYAHCSEVCVPKGVTVRAGDTLALVGSTGLSTGNHVHVEWRENGTPIDPINILPKETYV